MPNPKPVVAAKPPIAIAPSSDSKITSALKTSVIDEVIEKINGLDISLIKLPDAKRITDKQFKEMRKLSHKGDLLSGFDLGVFYSQSSDKNKILYAVTLLGRFIMQSFLNYKTKFSSFELNSNEILQRILLAYRLINQLKDHSELEGEQREYIASLLSGLKFFVDQKGVHEKFNAALKVNYFEVSNGKAVLITNNILFASLQNSKFYKLCNDILYEAEKPFVRDPRYATDASKIANEIGITFIHELRDKGKTSAGNERQDAEAGGSSFKPGKVTTHPSLAAASVLTPQNTSARSLKDPIIEDTNGRIIGFTL